MAGNRGCPKIACFATAATFRTGTIPERKDSDMRRIVQLLDWITRLHFLGTTGWAAGGWFVTFLAASAQGWDPVSVWVSSVAVGACCAVIFIAIKARSFPGIENARLVAAPALVKFEPNIGARDAFFMMLADSVWKRQQEASM